VESALISTSIVGIARQSSPPPAASPSIDHGSRGTRVKNIEMWGRSALDDRRVRREEEEEGEGREGAIAGACNAYVCTYAEQAVAKLGHSGIETPRSGNARLKFR